MTFPRPRHSLSPEEAVHAMREELSAMRRDPNRAQLEGVSPDVAFESGYEAAIHDNVRFRGPNPELIDD